MSRVYASLPLKGPAGRLGREVLRGAQLALEGADEPAELVSLDSFGEDREEQAVTNAWQAVTDDDAIAYLGDFHSSQILETAPVLGEADLLQVAPVATFIGLEGSTLVRPASAAFTCALGPSGITRSHQPLTSPRRKLCSTWVSPVPARSRSGTICTPPIQRYGFWAWTASRSHGSLAI